VIHYSIILPQMAGGWMATIRSLASSGSGTAMKKRGMVGILLVGMRTSPQCYFIDNFGGVKITFEQSAIRIDYEAD